MTEDWKWRLWYALGILYFVFAVAVIATAWVPGFVIFGVVTFFVFCWADATATARGQAEHRAFEEKYAAMNDTQKIDYHLDRSRRLGTNHDANIAQALIEKGRK